MKVNYIIQFFNIFKNYIYQISFFFLKIPKTLYTNKIIIADEPTGNLDKETENEILKIFNKLSKKENKCIIIVTHSANVCDNVDIVYELKQKSK